MHRVKLAAVGSLAALALAAPAAAGVEEGYVFFDFAKKPTAKYVPFETDFPKARPGTDAFETGLVTRHVAVTTSAPAEVASGLDWRDVAVGIGIGIGLSTLLAAGAIVARGKLAHS